MKELIDILIQYYFAQRRALIAQVGALDTIIEKLQTQREALNDSIDVTEAHNEN